MYPKNYAIIKPILDMIEKGIYIAPEMEIVDVRVELGFAASSPDSGVIEDLFDGDEDIPW